MASSYVHGYSDREAERLHDQASSVRDLLHHDTRYPGGVRVLEAACGVGSQTVTLAQNNPDSQFISLDVAADSLARARSLIQAQGLTNVRFHQADIFSLPFSEGCFDHVFVCYLLEHLPDPERALLSLGRVLKANGSITVIEGDHGSCYFHPETPEATRVWRCLIDIQAQAGGNSLIGRQVFPLLTHADFRDVQVSPRVVYMDQSKPALMEGFVKNTIIPMVEGVETQALDMGLVDLKSWRKGIADLHYVAESREGTFCYTFFKVVGRKPDERR